jgi:epoxide hydrolase 4
VANDTLQLTDVAVRHERIPAAGVTLHVVTAGAGPPVILLHGFPEYWIAWRHQIGPLVRAGFRVLAPDLRGYNLSDRPCSLDGYHIRFLIDDVAALVRSTGHARAHVVGHDWGGIIAWTFAGAYPELVDKLVILDAPHIDIYMRKARRPPQMFRSWYVLFFQLPWLPEKALSANNFRAIRRLFGQPPARDNRFSQEHIEHYVRALSQPGALTAALNYYRALYKLPGATALARAAHVRAPTLIIWGDMDQALSTVLLEGVIDYAPDVRVHMLPGVGHWVMSEAADDVSDALVSFLTQTEQR